MKKQVLALAAVMMLAACSSSTRTKTNRVAFVGMPGINAYFTAMQTEFTKQFTAKGQNAEDVNGSFTASEQVSQCELYLDNNPDYLFIWPNDPESMTNVVTKAHEQGTKIVSFVEEIPDADAYVVTDPAELAGQSAQIASKWINTKFADATAGSVNVVVVYDSSKSNVVTQANAMKTEIAKNTKVNANIGYISVEEGTDKGKSWADLYLVDHAVDVVLSPNCSTSMGVSNSMLTQTGRNLSKSAIFTVNIQSAEDAAAVASSKENKCMVRGGSNAGNGAAGTINDFVSVWEKMEAGTAEKGYRQNSINTYLYEDTEYSKIDDVVIK